MVAKRKQDEPNSGTTRTTLTLGNEAMRLVRRRAKDAGQTMGEAATDLILASENPGGQAAGNRAPRDAFLPNDDDQGPIPGHYYNGILLVPKRGDRRPVTLELVQELLDDVS